MERGWKTVMTFLHVFLEPLAALEDDDEDFLADKSEEKPVNLNTPFQKSVNQTYTQEQGGKLHNTPAAWYGFVSWICSGSCWLLGCGYKLRGAIKGGSILIQDCLLGGRTN